MFDFDSLKSKIFSTSEDNKTNNHNDSGKKNFFNDNFKNNNHSNMTSTTSSESSGQSSKKIKATDLPMYYSCSDDSKPKASKGERLIDSDRWAFNVPRKGPSGIIWPSGGIINEFSVKASDRSHPNDSTENSSQSKDCIIINMPSKLNESVQKEPNESESNDTSPSTLKAASSSSNHSKDCPNKCECNVRDQVSIDSPFSIPEDNRQNQLETYVTQAREGLESYFPPQIRDTFKSMGDMIAATKTSTNDLIEHIQNPENQASRAAFVTSSGFIGYILGGKGIIKRSLFGIIAVGGAAAICEPKIAKDYAEVTVELAKSRISDLYEEAKNTEFVKDLKIPSLKEYFGTDKKQ